MLIEAHGFPPMVRLLEAFDRGADLDQAFAEVFDLTPEEIDEAFLRFVDAELGGLRIEPRWSQRVTFLRRFQLTRTPPEDAAERAECAGCHRGQGTLLEWGVRADYEEKFSEDPLPVVCSVCHSAHDATFAGQLRFPVETTSITLHLCARCHDRRSVPDPNSEHGLEPHAPEAELLKGNAGWFPPDAGFAPGTLLNSHGNDVNQTLCAKCHVEPFTITDPDTGDFEFQAVGHTFQAIPCLDENGIPNGETDCEVSQTARSWNGCTGGPCHSNTEGPEALLTFKVETQIRPAAEALLALLTIVDPNLDEPGGEIDAENPTFTVAEGAYFNYHLAYHGGDYKGSATHNPKLIPALLEASIEAVEDEYDLGL